MPDAGGDDTYRFVVDESSFDFRGIDEAQLTDLLHDFSDTLSEVAQNHAVAASPWWFDVECTDGRALYDVLYEGGTPKVGRDARLRLLRMMDRCPPWDAELPGVPADVRVATGCRATAFSIGYAWWHAARGHHVACLVFPASDLRGWRPVSAQQSASEVEHDICFLAAASALPDFWRSLFSREDVQEQEFFDRAREAFPRLAFAETLTFRKFDGTYAQMRDWVVDVLAVVHDHFADALVKHAGQPSNVGAELGSRGVNLSPESPNTRSKPGIMKQRDVDHHGEQYRCEWHAKKEAHRNRIHFSLPDPRLDGRILIGIFVDHLATE